MAISTYIKSILESGLLGFLVLFVCTSCSEDLLGDSEFSLNNESVFTLQAKIEPKTKSVSTKDTFWITVEYGTREVLLDMVSQANISLNQAKFFCALQFEDQIDPSNPVKYSCAIKSGKIDQQIDNGIGFEFGHPDEVAKLEIGIVFKNPGRYAMWFNNTPNPYVNCDIECRGDVSYHYDVFHEFEASSKEYKLKDFVDYVFDYTQNHTEDRAIAPYLNNAIHNNSIIICSVR